MLDARVNSDRLWSRLMEMATIGATELGGVNRQALTDLDFEGRALLLKWAQAAGCTTRVDAIGNLFVRRAGTNDGLPVVMTGSHLDTQPSGGKFDGVYGVLAGLEVLESLNDFGIRTAHPVEVCVWCNEEGVRFPAAMMGSAVWSGRMSMADAYGLTARDGATVRGELLRGGYPVDIAVERAPAKAFLEVHIEQGPILEQEGRVIGLVTGVQHMSRYEICIEGQAAHAGPTPMHGRRDPVRALGGMLPALYQATEQCGAAARLTIGCLEAQPGSANTVPSAVRFTVDVRHPLLTAYRALRADVEKIVSENLRRFSLEGSVRCIWEAPGVTFDPLCIEAVRHAAMMMHMDVFQMVSGAGHDSCNVSAVVPTAMIFVPCAGGLSHNEAESATAEHLAAGANVLLQAMLALSVTH